MTDDKAQETKNLEEQQRLMEQDHNFGLLLATSAQLLSGMFSSAEMLDEHQLDELVPIATGLAEELIKDCKRKAYGT